MDLIPSVLRMRPNYTVIGEIRRPAEVRALLEIVAVGSTGLTTFHASSLKAALNRLLNMGFGTRQISMFKVWILVRALNRESMVRRVIWEICEYNGKSLVCIFKRDSNGLSMAVKPERSIVVKLTAERANMSVNEVLSVIKKKAEEYGF